MSHCLETMAYTGEIPWHQLGTFMGNSPIPGQEMEAAAGLCWTVEKAPLYLAGGEQVESFATLRDTDNTVLGIVSEKYVPVQNRHLFELCETVLGADARFESAASLRGGQRVFALAVVPGGADVVRPDGTREEMRPYLLAANGHDGLFGLRLQFTSVRVVCQNTLSAAVSEKDVSGVWLRHRKNVESNADRAAEVLRGAVEFNASMARLGTGLAAKPMDATGFASFASDLFEFEKADTDRKRTNAEALISEVAGLFFEGQGNRGESSWDALNAVSEWVDHRRQAGRKAATAAMDHAKRLDDSLFGNGAELKGRALRLLSR